MQLTSLFTSLAVPENHCNTGFTRCATRLCRIMSSVLANSRRVLRCMRGKAGSSLSSSSRGLQPSPPLLPWARSRALHSSPLRAVNISFYEESSEETIDVDAEEGKTVLDIAMDHKIDIEGACGGELACSTCHVILEQEYFDRLPPKTEEEEDMLDLAWGVTDLSRLGCQMKITRDFEGMRIVVPSESNSML